MQTQPDGVKVERPRKERYGGSTMTDLQQPPTNKSAPALDPARPVITFPKIGIKSGRIDVFSSGLVIAFLNNLVEFDLGPKSE